MDNYILAHSIRKIQDADLPRKQMQIFLVTLQEK